MRYPLLYALLFAAACTPASKTDDDGDGIMADIDCNDFDQTKGAPETFFQDEDGDGYGGENSVSACESEQPDGYVRRDGDCDDSLPSIHPAAVETCNTLDDDCDGWTDEGTEKGVWYTDSDGDGFGDPESKQEACTRQEGWVENRTDCDDEVSDIYPGAPEWCDGVDNNCDANVDENTAVDVKTWYVDYDGDSWGNPNSSFESCNAPGAGWIETAGDCNDLDNSISPDADEICDFIDNNCDGDVDGVDAIDASYWYADSDGDGYGDSTTSIASCHPIDGYTSDNQDCDDTSSWINPETVWYADTDSDSYGDPDSTTQSCLAPSGYLSNGRDCDDTNGDIKPGATEVCDGVDNNCDGLTDDSSASDATVWYADFDGDGYGSGTVYGTSCDAPEGFVDNQDDCDDYDETEYPGATWYLDTDGDGYGSDTDTTTACELPSGYVAYGGDCDETDELINPGATEYCDGGIDNDCDGDIDTDDPSNAGDKTWYADTDEDGYGDVDVPKAQCSQPSGYITDATDCDDTMYAVNPGSTEVCNDGYDNDCDGTQNDCGWVGDVDAGDSDYVITGSSTYAYSGYFVSAGGDIDNDGFDDLLIGAYGASSYAGQVYVISGDSLASGSNSATSVATATLTGPGTYKYAGRAVTGGGDFNNDGYDDVLVGCYYCGPTSYTGEAYLFLGPLTGAYTMDTDEDAAFYGGNTYDYNGWAVANLGDFNDDGYDDVIMGAYAADPGGMYSAGAAYIMYGESTPSGSTAMTTGADLTISGSTSYIYLG